MEHFSNYDGDDPNIDDNALKAAPASFQQGGTNSVRLLNVSCSHTGQLLTKSVSRAVIQQESDKSLAARLPTLVQKCGELEVLTPSCLAETASVIAMKAVSVSKDLADFRANSSLRFQTKHEVMLSEGSASLSKIVVSLDNFHTVRFWQSCGCQMRKITFDSAPASALTAAESKTSLQGLLNACAQDHLDPLYKQTTSSMTPIQQQTT
jgi:hypothetical protein